MQSRKYRIVSILLILCMVIPLIASIFSTEIVQAAPDYEEMWDCKPYLSRIGVINSTMTTATNDDEDYNKVKDQLDIVNWAPASDGYGTSDDYVLVGYNSSNKKFYVAYIERKGSAPSATEYPSVKKCYVMGELDATNAELKQWLWPDMKDNGSNRGVYYGCSSYGSEPADYWTTMDFKDKYLNAYMYDDIIEDIEGLAGDNSIDYDAIECLLHLLVNKYNKNFDNSTETIVCGNAAGYTITVNLNGEDNWQFVYNYKRGHVDGNTGEAKLEETSKSLGNLFECLATKNTNINATEYPVLSRLQKVAKTVSAGGTEEDIAADAVENAEITFAGLDVTTGTEFDKWSYAIFNYALNGEKTTTITPSNTTGTAAAKDYKISELGDADGLTDEEMVRLKVYLYLVTRHVGSSATKATDADSDLDVKNNYLKDIKKLSIGGGYTPDEIHTAAEAASTKYQSSSASDINFRTIVTHCDAIAKYCSAKIYGLEYGSNAVYDPNSGVAQQSADIVTQCQYIENMIPWLDQCTETIQYNEFMPKMTKIKKVDDSEEAYKNYAALLYTYGLLVRFAQSDAGLTNTATTTTADPNDPNATGDASSAGKWINEDIEAVMVKASNNTDNSDLDVSSIQKYFTAYEAIHEFLNYLGIEPGAESALGKIDEYYNFIQSYIPEETTDAAINDYSNADSEAFRKIFSVDDNGFSEDYKTGVALSATYIPMETNVYDVNALSYLSEDNKGWVERFHYGWGFYRKALFIDTNVNAAVENYVENKSKGETRVATLKDLLQPEKDVVLYVDDKFYNVNKLAELQGLSYNKAANEEVTIKDTTQATASTSVWDKITDSWDEFMDQDVESITKTGGITTYSANVHSKVSKSDQVYQKGNPDQNTKFVLGSDKIDKYLNVDSTGTAAYCDEYTPLQSFAVVSAIYRQNNLWSLLRKENSRSKPVFMSSATLPFVNGAKKEQWNVVYNYIMLKNLEAAMGIDYESTLDINSPLYIDVYGNILTESGLVVIPAASNATLWEPDKYTIYTTGFLSLYRYGEYKLLPTQKNSDFAKEFFEVSNKSGQYELKDREININGGTTIYTVFGDLRFNNDTMPMTFQQLSFQLAGDGGLRFKHQVYLITEVLRGAPLDCIDKTFEGLEGKTVTSEFSIWMAAKLETLMDQLLPTTNGNTFLTLPNIAFIDGVEYVIFFAFKILAAVLLVLLVYRCYIDAVNGILGVRSAVAFVIACTMFLVAAFSIPSLMDISYYQVNKQLLQSETQYIAMLNEEKRSEGREIGVTAVNAPESKTTLYLKVDDVSIPWYVLVGDVMLNNSVKTVSEAYDEEFNNSPLANLPGVYKKQNGLYMSIEDIFDESQVNYDPEYNVLTTSVKEIPYVSYVVPYYAILDYMVNVINKYNKDNGITSCSLTTQSGGSVKTKGLISPYLTSATFMENSQDTLGLKKIYQVKTNFYEKDYYTDSDKEVMRSSYWYNEIMEYDEREEKLDKLNQEARMFIVNNRGLLDKVSDETFLKVMAMSLAVRHNDIMNISSGNAIEIYDVDAKDIIRLAVADKTTVMKNSSKSFARFIFDYGGTLGIIMTTLLMVAYFVSSIIKPLCVFAIIAVTIISLVIKRLVSQDDRASVIEGFLITLAILCGINSLYAVVLKASLRLADMGISMTVNIIIQLVIQALYIAGLVFFTGIVLFDWQNFGFDNYQMFASKISHGRFGLDNAELAIDNAKMKIHRGDRDKEYQDLYKQRGRGKRASVNSTGREVYENMRSNDERRWEVSQMSDHPESTRSGRRPSRRN